MKTPTRPTNKRIPLPIAGATCKTIRALWKQRKLIWCRVGLYWYCAAEYIHGPTGYGYTKDDAFLDYKGLLK